MPVHAGVSKWLAVRGAGTSVHPRAPMPACLLLTTRNVRNVQKTKILMMESELSAEKVGACVPA